MPLSRITRARCRHRRLRSLPSICRYRHLEFRTEPPCGVGGGQPGSETVRGSHQTSDQVREADCFRYRQCHDRSREERSLLYSAAHECESRGRDQDEGHSLGSSADQHISPLTSPATSAKSMLICGVIPASRMAFIEAQMYDSQY